MRYLESSLEMFGLIHDYQNELFDADMFKAKVHEKIVDVKDGSITATISHLHALEILMYMGLRKGIQTFQLHPYYRDMSRKEAIKAMQKAESKLVRDRKR